jgi:tRNA (guanine37-N1)-methyltransferase
MMTMTTKKTARRATTKRAVRFHILTIFPNIFESYLGESLFKRAQKEKLLSVKVHNIRDYTTDRHNKVDDRPFGGGPGMVLKIQPIWAAITAIKKIAQRRSRKPEGKIKKVRTIIFSPRGKKFDAATARRLARYDELILICGRYEGVDERVTEHVADEAISIGDYVLSGGELPALVLMEAVSRQLPGFLGKEESLEEVNGSFPTYTRPEIFMPSKGAAGTKIKKEWKVPAILLSGDHKKVGEWRAEKGAISKE